MIITVIVFQRINSVLPNKSMPNYRKAGWSNIKLPNKFKPNYRKYHSILPNIELINYLCSSKCFNLWMVTDIE